MTDSAITQDEFNAAVARVFKDYGPTGVALLAAVLAGPFPAFVAGISAVGLRAGLEAYAKQLLATNVAFFDECARFVREHGVPEDPVESQQYVEALWICYQRCLETVDPDAKRALARLAALYERAPLDPFFRSAGRVLQDLTGEEIRELAELVGAMERTTWWHDLAREGEQVVAFEIAMPVDKGAAQWPTATLTFGIPGVASTSTSGYPDDPGWPLISRWNGVFHAMRVHGLATDGRRSAGPNAISIHRETVFKLDRLLNGARPAAR